jgi:hypothetical protein
MFTKHNFLIRERPAKRMRERISELGSPQNGETLI